MPVTYGNIAGQEPSTVTFRVATVVIPRGSTSEQQEILTLGDPQTSNALARVLDTAPGSTEFGLVTRIAGSANVAQTSTVWATQAAQSGAWTVSVSGYSTTAQISSVGGIVTVQPNSTAFAANAGFTFDSSGALLTAGGGVAGSTIVTVSTGSVGLAGAYDSSNVLVKIADSVNSALRVNVVAGAAGGSTIVTVSQVQSIKPTWSAKSSVTVTLASLANTNRRETTAFFSTAYSDYKILVNTKGTTASSAFLNIYVYESLGDTSFTGSATGTDAAFSTSVPLAHLRFLGAIQMTTNAAFCSQIFNLSDVMAAPPSNGGLVFDNQSAGTLSSTSADHSVFYQGLT